MLHKSQTEINFKHIYKYFCTFTFPEWS